MPQRLETAPSAPVAGHVAEGATAEQITEAAATAAAVVASGGRVPAPAGPSSHEQAAAMCRRIDACFAELLPVKELGTGALPEGAEEDIGSQVKQLTDSAKWLDAYFQSLREQSEQPDVPAYEREIAELEQELEAKDELLAGCTKNIQEWKAKLQKLQAEHEHGLHAI